MIFVTVGTHEQPFDRLIKKIDEFIDEEFIKEEVIIQSGYSEYNPIYCKKYDLLGHEAMNEYVQKSSIVITHGGPGSIMLALQHNKIPIVVPRQAKFNEHVDNHQLMFTKRLEQMNKVLAVYDIELLKETIANYNSSIGKIDSLYLSNTSNFVAKFEKEMIKLMK